MHAVTRKKMENSAKILPMTVLTGLVHAVDRTSGVSVLPSLLAWTERSGTIKYSDTTSRVRTFSATSDQPQGRGGSV